MYLFVCPEIRKQHTKYFKWIPSMEKRTELGIPYFKILETIRSVTMKDLLETLNKCCKSITQHT